MKKAITLALVGLTIGTWGLEARAVKTLGPSCGKWIAAKQSEQTNPSRQRDADIGWLAGFMTGAAMLSNKDILAGTDQQSIVLWMDNWCQANPLKAVSSGGNVLFLELEKQIKPTEGR